MRDIAAPRPSCESSLSYAPTHSQLCSSRLARRVAVHPAGAEELTFTPNPARCHDARSDPHRRGVARGGASASPADGAAPDDERPRLGRAALSECLKRAPVCACPLLWIALLLSSCGPHHPRPKVTRLLGTAPLHRGGALQADGERRTDPVNYSEGCRRPRWPRAACPSPCKHCG